MCHIYTGFHNASCHFIHIQSVIYHMGLSIWLFINSTNPTFNLKLISDFKLMNLTKTKSNFILIKLPPLTNAPIVNFMQTLE